MKLCLIHAISLVGIGIVVITQRNFISLKLLLVQSYRQNDKRNVILAHSFYDGGSNDKLKTAKNSRLYSVQLQAKQVISTGQKNAL